MEEDSKIVALSLGSNLGDKVENLKSAINQLEVSVGEVLNVSENFHSRPLGFQSENEFVNCCCIIKTKLSIYEFISETQKIELDLGRLKKKMKEYEDRIIDIDVIFFGDQIIKSENLTIPHENFRKRDFVLLPLNQILNQIDPETFISVNQFTN